MLRDGKLTKLKEASSLSFFSSSCFPPSKKKSPAALYPPPQSTCLCLSPQATTCSPIHPSTSMTFSTTSVPAIPHRHTSRATPFCLGRSPPLLKKMGSFSLFPRAIQCPLVSKHKKNQEVKREGLQICFQKTSFSCLNYFLKAVSKTVFTFQTKLEFPTSCSTIATNRRKKRINRFNTHFINPKILKAIAAYKLNTQV